MEQKTRITGGRLNTRESEALDLNLPIREADIDQHHGIRWLCHTRTIWSGGAGPQRNAPAPLHFRAPLVPRAHHVRANRSRQLGGLHIFRRERLGPDAPINKPIIPVGDRKGLLADLTARFGWRPNMVTKKFINRFASRTGVPNVGIRQHASIA
jgi:hypothetical protein